MKKKILHIILIFLLNIPCAIISCDREDPEPESKTVTDIDGNVYHVVKIFTQYWMAENLKTTRLNDGKPITLASTNWFFDKEPSRCFYNNDGAAFRDDYGMLYNMYAVYTGKLCPVGWHVPKETEWNTLSGYLQGYLAGGKLKEAGTEHWNSPNTGADNSTGFSALPGGQIDMGGTFSGMGTFGRWWVDNSPAGAIVVEMRYNSAALYPYGSGIYFGHSVRCIKDANP
jgi:uncharacterized protein (TIGR02145 family)